MACLCILDHFLECCLWASLGEGPTSSFFYARWEICTLGSILLLFSYCLIGVLIRVLVSYFLLIRVPIEALLSDFPQRFTLSLSSPFS